MTRRFVRSPQANPGALAEHLRRIARRLRHLPDRWLHPLRRRLTLRRLSSLDGPVRHVLFVCHGNICRSPYAERRFDALTEGTIEAMSAGFVGSDRQPPDAALQIAGELGVSLHGHVSRTVDRALLRRVDLVVVMEPGQLRELRWLHGAELAVVLGDLDPARPERRSIEDPIFQPQEVFRRVYERIDRCLSELIEALGSVEAADPPPGRSS